MGYRAWLVSADGQLKSIGVPDHVWTSATATAECRHSGRGPHVGVEHDAPVWECTCGIHAFTSLSDAIGFMGERLVAGVVRGWGRTIHHGDEGWRSEHAEIVALAPVYDGAGIDGHLRAFASREGTIVTTLPALRVIAGEHGAGESRRPTR